MTSRLPPFKSLLALECVVRTGSVTAAAAELCVTHGAVSKHIQTLEQWVGEPLFGSNRRQMAASPAAVRLADSVGIAVNLIATSLSIFEEEKRKIELRVSAPATFAMRWLIPRLPNFHRSQKGIEVRVHNTHTSEDWREIPFDVAIRRGPQVPAGYKAISFLREEMTLVCTASLAASCAGSIDKIPLLKSDTRLGELETWLLAASTSVRLASRATAFPHFYIALEAALAGQGAVVAPLSVVEDLLMRGDLVEFDPRLRVKGADHIALVEDHSSPGAPAQFTAWLCDIASKPRSAT
ncbi:LysR substrate-binding domain-containing protein [Rhizobium sp.]